ncbi:hypothetical protein [Mariniflexile sp.]|uniref:hypothetical protein n=1 Tax=Mariniflexile sp. TaxID=1979402 RepID=UPI00356233BA
MKNLLVGLLLFGLTTQGFSQQKQDKIQAVKLQDVVITQNVTKNAIDEPVINLNYVYLDKVNDETTAYDVKLLEAMASRYDVKNSPNYDGVQETYQTIFRGDKGYIIATYDNESKILKTKERYTDIKIPKKMVNSILMKYPKSHFLKVVHNVNYSQIKGVKKTYKIRILNNNETKNLKITSKGNNDNAYTMSLEK